MSIFSKIVASVLGLAATLGIYTAPIPSQPVQVPESTPVVETLNSPAFGAAIPNATALFETSLASRITSTDTSMTLVSGTTKDGTTLSGYYGFIIDEGTASQEFVLGTASGTSVTGLVRGVSVVDASTTISALRFEHRRAASVKITSYPALGTVTRILRGVDTIPAVLRYDSAITTSSFTNSRDLISRSYADALAFGAVPAASETASGFVELSTAAEAASTTQTGTVARLVVPTSITTSTAPTSGNVVPVTKADGNLDQGFLNLATEAWNFTATTTFATSAIPLPVVRVYTASTTWTKPTNLRYITVEVVGAGGGGGGNTTAGFTSGGGGGGGYSKETITASTLSATSSVVVGTGGTAGPGSGGSGGTGGTSSFGTGPLLQATGGVGGSSDDSGGTGGIGTLGDINAAGQGGGGGDDSAAAPNGPAGFGGSSVLGGGAPGVYGANGVNDHVTGIDGRAYGGGGGGGYNGSGDGSDVAGGAGANGVVIVTEYYL